MSNSSSVLGAMSIHNEFAMALRYAEYGLSVIPIHAMTASIGPEGVEELVCSCHQGAACDRPGKHAAVRWKRYQTECADEKQLRRWFDTAEPRRGVAIVTGEVSGLIDVEIDPHKGGEASWAEIVAGREVPPTWTFISGGGGPHRCFRLPDGGLIRTTSGIRPGVDVRGEGGMAVVPPSRHRSGRCYEWVPGHAPWECELAEIPDWLLEVLPRAHEGSDGPIPVRTPSELLDEIPRAREALARLDPQRAFDRNQWRDVGFSVCELGEAGLSLWKEWSATCESKYSEAECDRSWASFRPGGGITLRSLYYWAKTDASEGKMPDLQGLVLDAAASPPTDRHSALIESHARFRSTWNHTRRDLDSIEQFDMALVRFTLEDDWSPQEVADTVIAFRRKHGNDDDLEKAIHTDYVRGLIARLVSEREDDGPRLLGTEIVEILQYGQESPKCTLLLPDGVEISGVDMTTLLSHAQLERVLFAVGVLMHPQARKLWANVMAYLLSRVTRLEAPSEKELTLDWITDCMSIYGVGLVDDDMPESDALGMSPMALDREGGFTLRLTERIAEDAQRRFGRNTDGKAIGQRLRDVGLSRGKVLLETEAGYIRGPVQQVRCWRGGPGFIGEETTAAFFDWDAELRAERSAEKARDGARHLESDEPESGRRGGGPKGVFDLDAITKPEERIVPRWDGETLPDEVEPVVVQSSSLQDAAVELQERVMRVFRGSDGEPMTIREVTRGWRNVTGEEAEGAFAALTESGRLIALEDGRATRYARANADA